MVALLIAMDSRGAVFFTQVRITVYGRPFRIIKFRTMIADAEQRGPQITAPNDSRVTKVGRLLRKYRIDEMPQLLNVLCGDMSFVGTRPETKNYYSHYTNEMRATLLLPAGITSRASILFRDEASILAQACCIEEAYIKEVLPLKMQYNLQAIRNFSLLSDLHTMIDTLLAVVGIGDKYYPHAMKECHDTKH